MKRIANSNFARRNGILLVLLGAVILWTALVWIIAAHSATVKTKNKLTAEYDTIYEARMQAFTEEVVALNTPTEDEVLAKQMNKEADLIARVIGTMGSGSDRPRDRHDGKQTSETVDAVEHSDASGQPVLSEHR